MLRFVYRCALRLHPSSFRERFAEEMLYIFDQQRGTRAAFGLVLDSFFSLLRQWTLRPHIWVGVSRISVVEPTNGAPSFATLDNFRPRMSTIVHGMVLSILLFCMTIYAVRYSWIHVLDVRTIETVFHPNQVISLSRDPNYSASSSANPALRDSEKSRLISDHLQVDVIPVERESTSRADKTSQAPTSLRRSHRFLYSFDLSHMSEIIFLSPHR